LTGLAGNEINCTRLKGLIPSGLEIQSFCAGG
jgi:hypothetical protein